MELFSAVISHLWQVRFPSGNLYSCEKHDSHSERKKCQPLNRITAETGTAPVLNQCPVYCGLA